MFLASDERAVFAPLTQLQVALYEAILEFPSSKSVIQGSDPCECSSGKARIACCHKLTKDDVIHQRKEIFHVITLLRKVANHAALLLPYHRASDKQKELALSICKNLFGKFPVLEDVYRNGSFARMSDTRFSGKLKILNRLLTAAKERQDKVLMFSSSVQLLNILEAYVVSKGHNYERFDGETKPEARIGIVREFNNNPDVFICLVSTKDFLDWRPGHSYLVLVDRAGGLGLNFTGANVVVIFDPAWNPSFDNQAQDRAYRIGQRRNVRVYRLIAEGSIEENIYLRQIYKQQLSNIAVHSRNERRLFMGVAGVKSMQGELFGLRNLLMLRPGDSNLTNDLLKRTENIESGVRVVNYEVRTNAAEFSEFDHSDMEKSVQNNGNKGSQNIDQFTSSIDSFVANSIALSCGEDEEEEIIGKNDAGFTFREDSHSSSHEDEPPLNSNLSKRRREEKRSLRRDFTALRKPKRIKTDSSSDDDAAVKTSKSAAKIDRTLVKKNKFVSKKNSNNLNGESIILDGILDKCGVKYTSTADKVMSRSVAEEKMTTEAIRDVFWHGMYSQEPAHFIDPSSSEESDDIPFLTKKIIAKSEGDKKPSTRKSYPAPINARVFERIGSDMFLIGASPPLIRRQQFDSIARHYGFDSSLEFACSLVMLTENQVREKLFEFYKAKEPNIVNTSSFKSIYGAISSKAEHIVGSDLNNGSTTKSKKSFRTKRNTQKNQCVFKRDLDLCSVVSNEDLGREENVLSVVKTKFEHEELLCGTDRSLSSTWENVPSGVERKSKIFGIYEKSSDGSSNRATKTKEVETEKVGDYEEAFTDEVRPWNDEKRNEIDDEQLLSERDSMESGESVLDELMFNPVCIPVDRPIEAMDSLVEEPNVAGCISDNHPDFSVLDELMNGSVAFDPADGNDKGEKIDCRSRSSINISLQSSDSQSSISVLDELMG